jgi:putative transposase
MIVSDNGSEFTSNAILRWSKEHHVEWHYHRTRQTDAERLH